MEERPKVAIIIPEKDHLGITLVCLFSIVNQSKYPKDKLIVYLVDTGSTERTKTTLINYIAELKEDYGIDIRFIERDYYNFAKINNDVVTNCVEKDTDYILLMNNDVELIDDAITLSVERFEKDKDNIGTIGVRLMYSNMRIQHMGIDIHYNKIGKLAFTHYGVKERYSREYQSYDEKETYGNTGAFLLTPLRLWNEIGGLNEDYKVCFEDVEYNVECLKRGKKNITLTKCSAFHRESSTRGKEINRNDLKLIREFVEKSGIEIR